MDRKKIVIIGLIAIALLFFIGLGAGFVLNTDQEPEPSEFKSNEWRPLIAAMDALLAPFAPPLDHNRLKPRPGCQRAGDNIYVLRKNASKCIIDIEKLTGDDADKYQKIILELSSGGSSRDAMVSAQYEPSEEDDPAVARSGEQIRLIALKDGGTLTLTCTNCDRNDGRTVWVAFK